MPKVMVVPSSICKASEELIPYDAILKKMANTFTYKERSEAEYDPEWRQVIPYILCHHGDDYALFQRHKGGEPRLKGKTLGVGGHLEWMADPHFGTVFAQGAIRELTEETHFTPESMRFMGVICLDKDEVSKVHIGVLLEMELPYLMVEAHKGDELRHVGYFNPWKDEKPEGLESWSELVWEHLKGMK